MGGGPVPLDESLVAHEVAEVNRDERQLELPLQRENEALAWVINLAGFGFLVTLLYFGLKNL